MKETVSFRVDPPADGPHNMAADLALLDFPDGSMACRVYTWNAPWVTLGRFQRAERDVIAGFKNWIKRPTGGKAVLHGHDLTVALSMPLPTGQRNVRQAYRKATLPLLAALKACGVPAQLGEEVRPERREARIADCFAVTAGCDVIDGVLGHKLCGCALLIKETRLLLQASIPYQTPLIDPSYAIVGAEIQPVREWGFEGFPSALQKAWVNSTIF